MCCVFICEQVGRKIRERGYEEEILQLYSPSPRQYGPSPRQNNISADGVRYLGVVFNVFKKILSGLHTVLFYSVKRED
jgi:hypothetical protein